MGALRGMVVLTLAMVLAVGACKSDEEKAAEKEAAALEAAAEEARQAIEEKKAAAKPPQGDEPDESVGEAPESEEPAPRARKKGPTVRKKSDPWEEERAARAAKAAEGAVALRPEPVDEAGERALGPREDLPPPPSERPAPPAAAAAAAPPEKLAEAPAPPEKSAAPPAPAAPPAAPPPVPAVAEEAPPAPFSGKPLVIDHLLSLAEVVTLTGTKVRLLKDVLEGVPLSSGYNNLYFREKKAHKFGLALQVWKDVNIRDSRWRFKQMTKSYPNVTENTAVSPMTFFAYWDEIYYLVFLVQSERTIAAVSCGNHICTPETLLDVARKVHDRVASK